MVTKSSCQQGAKSEDASQLLKEISEGDSSQDLVKTEEGEIEKLTKDSADEGFEQERGRKEEDGGNAAKDGDFDFKDFDDDPETIGVEMVAAGTKAACTVVVSFFCFFASQPKNNSMRLRPSLKPVRSST